MAESGKAKDADPHWVQYGTEKRTEQGGLSELPTWTTAASADLQKDVSQSSNERMWSYEEYLLPLSQRSAADPHKQIILVLLCPAWIYFRGMFYVYLFASTADSSFLKVKITPVQADCQQKNDPNFRSPTELQHSRDMVKFYLTVNFAIIILSAAHGFNFGWYVRSVICYCEFTLWAPCVKNWDLDSLRLRWWTNYGYYRWQMNRQSEAHTNYGELETKQATNSLMTRTWSTHCPHGHGPVYGPRCLMHGVTVVGILSWVPWRCTIVRLALLTYILLWVLSFSVHLIYI